MEITFLRPIYLTFLVSIPFFIIMHFLILQHIKRRALKFANFEVIQRATGGQVLNKNIILLIIRLCAIVLFIFSTAGTVFWYEGKTSSYDFVIAVDTSSSMLADDFSPNRLVVAKDAAKQFVDAVSPLSQIGIVSFAGASFIEQELTIDKSTVKDKLEGTDIRPVGGTDLGEALITSTNMLLPSEKARAIVLLTDGQSNVGTDPEYGAEYARSHQVTVFTVGMATPEGGKFSKIDAVSKLDETMLKMIATNTGGLYFLAGTKEELASAYQQIALTADKKIAVDLQLPLMLLALFLLFVEWGLINTKYRTLP